MNTLTVEKQSAVVNNRRRERMFYTGMAVVFLLIVFAGFVSPYKDTRERRARLSRGNRAPAFRCRRR